VFTTNSRGLGTSFESGQAAHPSILLAAQIHILILISLKYTMDCSKIKFRQVQCLNLTW